MPIKRKKFIDKKNSVTFRLVHRSQKDPLVADEDAPQHVLLKCDKQKQVEVEKRQEEQRKFGIYFDDGYNYLQHLKDVNTVTDGNEAANTFECQEVKFSINLPSSVFQSNVEEREGLLNKAAPNPGPKVDWDPDIVATLDDDFVGNDGDELEDDFVAMANQMAGEDQENFSSGDMDDEDDDDFESDGSDSELSSESCEKKTQFTNYSMSSSVLPRSKVLQDVDEHFEKFFEKYDDEGIGALDCDDIQGYLKPDSELVQQLAAEYAESQESNTLKNLILSKREPKQRGESESDSSCEELTEVVLQEKPAEKWDCESIISSYSTTANRPATIDEPRKQCGRIQVHSGSGLPKGALHAKGLTPRMLKTLDDDSSALKSNRESKDVCFSERKKNETPDERRERKAVVKQLRRERRVEKKANQMAFKEEEERQAKVVLNLRQNVYNMKLH